MIKSIQIFSHDEAEKFKPPKNYSIISISSPGKKTKLKKGYSGKLKLTFHDIDGDCPGLTKFRLLHAVMILRFLRRINKRNRHLVINCGTGASRSVAVALFVSKKYSLRINTEKDLSNYNKLVYEKLVETDKFLGAKND